MTRIAKVAWFIVAIKMRCNTFLSTLIAKIKLRVWAVGGGSGLSVCGSFHLRNRGSIWIGRNVRINSASDRNPVGRGDKLMISVGKGASLWIGDCVGLSGVTIVASKSVTIEDSVLIGAGVHIYDTDFHGLQFDERGSSSERVGQAEVLICEGAFIGARSTILKGVRIGRGSVVGAGSVVPKSIPDMQVWAGNPARFIRNL